MPVIQKLTLKDLRLLDLVMSGEAARICGVDRRTFWKKRDLGLIKPAATIEGREVYRREDVLKLAGIISREKAAKK